MRVGWVRPVLLERQKERKGSPRKSLARKLAGKIAVARDFFSPATREEFTTPPRNTDVQFYFGGSPATTQPSKGGYTAEIILYIRKRGERDGRVSSSVGSTGGA